jgi:hypothetical protein
MRYLYRPVPTEFLWLGTTAVAEMINDAPAADAEVSD